MKNNNIPSDNSLPSMGRLVKSTVIAICIATVILVTVVLPAEYGLDPTGIGKLIGLAKMGEIKVSLAEEAAMETLEADKEIAVSPQADPAPEQPQITGPDSSADISTDKITITLEPDQGKEIKLTMSKGSTVSYSWYTNGGIANFDAHADSKKLNIKYHSYEKGKLEKSEGVMEAAFDGNHGWFWRNRTSQTMEVTLEVSGEYTEVLQF